MDRKNWGLTELLNAPQVKQEGNGPKDERAILMMASGIWYRLQIMPTLNYPDIHLHVAYNSNFGGPWSHGLEVMVVSEVVVASEVIKLESSDDL